jgi:hypothetical protein
LRSLAVTPRVSAGVWSVVSKPFFMRPAFFPSVEGGFEFVGIEAHALST